MTLIAFVIVSISAVLHAFWNFIIKRQNPQASFFLKASITSAVILSPILVIFREGLANLPGIVWVFLAVTGMVQALYYIFLASAYRNGDLSLTYPLARSLPVVLVALASVALGRGGQIHPLAYAGFILVAAGCILLPLPKFSDLHMTHYFHKWVLFSILAAICIMGYTLIDDQSMRVLRGIQTSPLSDLGWSLVYIELEAVSISIFLGLFLLTRKPGKSEIPQAKRSDWGIAALTGVIISVTYGLVLLAMGFVTNVSYVLAFRQLSIPIGAGLGMLVGKEPATMPKLVGIALVVAGLVLAGVG